MEASLGAIICEAKVKDDRLAPLKLFQRQAVALSKCITSAKIYMPF